MIYIIGVEISTLPDRVLKTAKKRPVVKAERERRIIWARKSSHRERCKYSRR